MKRIAPAILGAALLATAALPAAAEDDAATWLLLAEVSVSDGEVGVLQGCLDQERVTGMVNSFARKLEAVAAPVEESQPWLSCGEDGCP